MRIGSGEGGIGISGKYYHRPVFSFFKLLARGAIMLSFIDENAWLKLHLLSKACIVRCFCLTQIMKH